MAKWIGLLIGIAAVGGILWIKSNYSPEKLTSIRGHLLFWREAASQSTQKIPTPTPRSFSPETVQSFIETVSSQNKRLNQEMLPSVIRLFKKEKEAMAHWYENSSWPNAEYYGILMEAQKTRESLLPDLPDDCRTIHLEMTQQENLFLEALKAFDYNLRDQDFPPDTGEEMRDIQKRIDKQVNKLQKQFRQ
jgi:hypothetical protein